MLGGTRSFSHHELIEVSTNPDPVRVVGQRVLNLERVPLSIVVVNAGQDCKY